MIRLVSSELHVANPLIIKKYLNSNFTDVTFSVTKRRINEVAFGSADFLISLSGLLAYYCLIVKARTHSPVSVILSLCPCKRDKSPLTPCGFTANLKNGHLMKKRTKRLEIALSEDEYNALLERKTKARLAEFARRKRLNHSTIPRNQRAINDITEFNKQLETVISQRKKQSRGISR